MQGRIGAGRGRGRGATLGMMVGLELRGRFPMKCKIEVDMDNAAFEGTPAEEIACILEGHADLIRGYGLPTEQPRPIWDCNGNRVGQLVIED